MARKSLRNGKHLVELLEWAALPSMVLLSHVDGFECLKSLDPSQPEAAARLALIDSLGGQPQAQISIADEEASRLLQMIDFPRIEDLLEYAHRNLEFDGDADSTTDAPAFDTNADVISRLIWLRAKVPKLFDKIETIYLTHHFCGHKKFVSFAIADGQAQDFIWSDEVEQKLHGAVSDILALNDDERSNCEIIHFEMESNTDDQPRCLHYLVVYHPGKMKLLRHMQDRRRNLLPFIPALEATLVYDPHNDKVHVLSDRKTVAKSLADEFAKIAFAKPLSQERLDAINYELSMFKSWVDLKAAKITGAVIEDAWLSSLKSSLGHTRHSVTLNLESNADMWQVSFDHFGEHNPINSCRSVQEVVLSFLIRFDGEQKTRALDLCVGQRGTCNLMTQRDPKMRRCGEEILAALGVLKRVRRTAVGDDVQQFMTELKLLDMTTPEVDGYLLDSLQLPAQELVDKGLLKTKSWGEHVTVPIIACEGEPPVYRRLPVQSNSTETWATDDVDGTRYDLREGDLRRYMIDRTYLRERLIGLLSETLQDRPLTHDAAEPFYLGTHAIGNQQLPVFLVTGLDHDRHAEKLDTELRKQNLGLGIALTTTAKPLRRFLGSNLVVPIESLLDPSVDDVRLDMKRIDGEFKRLHSLAAASEQPRLIKEDGSAMLFGPWKEPWILTRPETIAAVEVLVNAWSSGKKQCTTKQVLPRFASARSVVELFKHDPNWKTYIRPADGNQKARIWELNVGLPRHAVPALDAELHALEPSLATVNELETT